MAICRKTRQQIEAEALDWFLHFQEGVADEPSRQTFAEWLLRSPLHIEEYLVVSSSWQQLNVGSHAELATDALVAQARSHHEDNVVRLPGRLGAPASLTRSSGRQASGRGWLRTLVASLVLASGALWLMYFTWQPNTFQTVIGEQRSFALQDGSVLFLNTNSKVRVAWRSSERHIDLVRGEARFKVAKDPTRPFVVATSTAAVRAIGTLFNVRAEALSTQVAVLEGVVEVTQTQYRSSDAQNPVAPPMTPAAPQSLSRISLGAGERAAVTSLGIEPDTGPSIEAVSAWTDRHLVFRDQPLSTVVAEFNRYRAQPLVLDDPQLAALKIGGVFDLNDPDSLIAYLDAYETVQIDRRSDGSQHLSRRLASRDVKK